MLTLQILSVFHSLKLLVLGLIRCVWNFSFYSSWLLFSCDFYWFFYFFDNFKCFYLMHFLSNCSFSSNSYGDHFLSIASALRWFCFLVHLWLLLSFLSISSTGFFSLWESHKSRTVGESPPSQFSCLFLPESLELIFMLITWVWESCTICIIHTSLRFCFSDAPFLHSTERDLHKLPGCLVWSFGKFSWVLPA